MTLLTDFITIAGIVITLLILGLLFRIKNRQLHQKLLILFFVTLCSLLLNSYAEVHEIAILFVLTFLLSFCIEVFIGPLLFLYIKSLFEDNRFLIRKNWFHFIPFLAFLLLIATPLLYYIFTEQYLFDYVKYFNDNSEIPEIILMVFLIGYLFASLRLFYKYSYVMRLNFSTIDESNFRWVKKMLMGTLFVSIVSLSITIYDFFVSKLDWEVDYVTLFSLIIWIAYLGYYGVNQTKVLLPEFLVLPEVRRKIIA